MQLKRNPSQDIIQFHLDMAINELGKIYPNFDPNDSHNIDTAKSYGNLSSRVPCNNLLPFFRSG